MDLTNLFYTRIRDKCKAENAAGEKIPKSPKIGNMLIMEVVMEMESGHFFRISSGSTSSGAKKNARFRPVDPADPSDNGHITAFLRLGTIGAFRRCNRLNTDKKSDREGGWNEVTKRKNGNKTGSLKKRR